MMGLVLVAACGASMAASAQGHVRLPIWPSWLWAGFLAGTAVGVPMFWSPAGVGRLLQPLTIVHPEWVGLRIDNVTTTLERFRSHPSALASCFGGAVLVQMTPSLFTLRSFTRSAFRSARSTLPSPCLSPAFCRCCRCR